MKSDRFFYSAAGALFLVMMVVGFHPFITNGTGVAGRQIDPGIFPIVLAHGLAIAAWYVLFFVQSLLITVKNRRLHMKLGWAAVAIAGTIACTGSMVAIRSVQISEAGFRFFGMEYTRFLLVMLTEIWLYTIFVAAGIVVRKKPKIHRGMMVLASLCLITGATARMPFLDPVFGNTGWVGLFGPVFCLGALLLAVRMSMTHTFDRWYAAGYAIFVVVFITSVKVSLTEAGRWLATVILKL
jgi:hypothetical protein